MDLRKSALGDKAEVPFAELLGASVEDDIELDLNFKANWSIVELEEPLNNYRNIDQ